MKNLYLFSGEQFKRERAIKEKLGNIKDQAPFDMDEIHLDGEEIEASGLIRELCSKSLFALGKLIWVKQSGHLKDQNRIAKKLGEISLKNTYIIFEFDKKATSNPIYKLIKKRGAVTHFAQVKRKELPTVVKTLCRRKGIKLTKDAFRYFLELIEVDLRRVENEITKLSWFADGKELTLDVVRELIFTTGEKNIFHLLDAIGNRDRKALKILRKLLENREEPSKIFYMLAGHVRSLLMVKSMDKAGFKISEIAQKTGQFNWLVKKKKEQAQNFSQKELIKGLYNLHQEDLLIKSGQRRPDLSVFKVALSLVG